LAKTQSQTQNRFRLVKTLNSTLNACRFESRRIAVKQYLLLFGVLALFHAVAETSVEPSRCLEFNEMATRGALSNRLDQANVAISAAMSQGIDVCAG
jgi:hypothetical protein